MSVILIVDDNEQNRYLLRAMLAASAYEVLEATNGVEALELARRRRPDLIISDILMPQMDGFALCRECKRDDRLRDIPFVFYTATYTDPRDEALALQLGAARFIVKPIEVEDFIAIMREVLQAHAAKQLIPLQPPLEEEVAFYRLYNEALIRKLEDKMLDLASLNRKLAESEERFRRLAENAPDLIYRYEFVPQRGFTYVSPAATAITGYTPEEHYADPELGFKIVHPDDRHLLESVARGEISPEQPIALRWMRKDGKIVWTEQRNLPLFDEAGRLVAIEGIARDITARKQAEEERERLQAQLIQVQKMEAVGRLAGGVAHDYNNMLSVILGYAEMALRQTDPADPLHAYLKEILNAAKRSAEITRQLLAFARQQPISPSVLDLNETVESTLKMLRHLIGENIELVWVPGSGLWPVRIDPSQIDQILINLCANARDAIDEVGEITIATDNVTFDEAHGTEHPGFIPGEFVLLAVSDNGRGMDEATLEHIFEPFFTTKELGQGTGLGLAVVYGIVKQNSGFLEVDSRPGRGTTFRIYLPRYRGEVESSEARRVPLVPSSRGETILLVEDEVSILKLGRKILEGCGYVVLAAAAPQEAIDLAQRHAGKIDLLITDVIMPQMTGRNLAERLRSLYPGLKTLFMSGYTAEVVSQEKVAEEGMDFIQKPFLREDLVAKVSEALGRV